MFEIENFSKLEFEEIEINKLVPFVLDTLYPFTKYREDLCHTATGFGDFLSLIFRLKRFKRTVAETQ